MESLKTKSTRSWCYAHIGSDDRIYHGDKSCRVGLPNSSGAHDKQLPLQKVEPILDPDMNCDGSCTSTPHSWRSGSVDRLLHVSASILTLLASFSLLVITARGRRSTGYLLSFVLHNRATAQIIVAIFSAVLASLNVYTATRLLNLATRIHMLSQFLSLNMVKFIGAVATRRFVTDLPVAMSTTSAIIALLFTIPGFLWTGALTPIVANTTILEARALKIPRYSTTSTATWFNNERLWQEDCTSLTTKEGIFSDCPIDTIQSGLLSRAAQASSDPTEVHSKNDNSHYSYIGRSYGVGSSAGLVDGNIGEDQSGYKVLSYTYVEPGYTSSLSCFHNASSDFHLLEVQEGQPKFGIPNIYYATGVFPNAPPNQSADFFSVVGQDGNTNIAVLAAKRYQGRNVILITAGSNYHILNGTQCEITFSPTVFTIGVDVANKLISVLPTTTTAASAAGHLPPSFDPTAGLADTIVNQLNGLGMVSTSLYTSVFGSALMSNMAAAASSNDTSSSATEFAAMENFFTAMVDDLLVFVGSSQFFIPDQGGGDFSTVDANILVQAIKIGEAKYVYVTFGICVALLLAVAAEAFRTRVWKQLPKWDFTDTTCLVLASAVAEDDVLSETSQDRGYGEVELTERGSGCGSSRGVRQFCDGDRQEKAPRLGLRLGRQRARVALIEQTRCCNETGHLTE